MHLHLNLLYKIILHSYLISNYHIYEKFVDFIIIFSSQHDLFHVERLIRN